MFLFLICVCMCLYVLVAQLCLTLFSLMDYSLPGSSVHGIFQARILEWVPIPFSRGSYRPRDRTQFSCIAGRFFTDESPGKTTSVYSTNIQWCPTSSRPWTMCQVYKEKWGRTLVSYHLKDNRVGACFRLLLGHKWSPRYQALPPGICDCYLIWKKMSL